MSKTENKNDQKKKNIFSRTFTSFIFLCFRWLVNQIAQHFPIENSALTIKKIDSNLPLTKCKVAKTKRKNESSRLMNEGHKQRFGWFFSTPATMTQYVNISTRHRWHSFLASIAKPPLKYTFDSNDLHFQDKKPKKNKKKTKKNKQQQLAVNVCTTTDRPNYMKQHVSISLSQSTSQQTTLRAEL